jgi:hypothetical protein
MNNNTIASRQQKTLRELSLNQCTPDYRKHVKNDAPFRSPIYACFERILGAGKFRMLFSLSRSLSLSLFTACNHRFSFFVFLSHFVRTSEICARIISISGSNCNAKVKIPETREGMQTVK